MAAAEESSDLSMIDAAYEFSAPRFHDFLTEETAEEVRRAELWFESALAHAPSRASASPLCLISMLIVFPLLNFESGKFRDCRLFSS